MRTWCENIWRHKKHRVGIGIASSWCRAIVLTGVLGLLGCAAMSGPELPPIASIPPSANGSYPISAREPCSEAVKAVMREGTREAVAAAAAQGMTFNCGSIDDSG